MTGYNPAPIRAERARHDATAFDWHTTEAAKAIIARWLFADEIDQTIVGHNLLNTQDALFNEMQDIEIELDAIRDERISDEVSNLSERDQNDDYLIEAIEESAPSVTTVLDEARKAARDETRWAA